MGDFVWKIKLNPSEATGTHSLAQEGGSQPLLLPGPCDAELVFSPRTLGLCCAEVVFLVSFSGNVREVAVTIRGVLIVTDKTGAAQPLSAKIPVPVEMFYREVKPSAEYRTQPRNSFG